MVEMPYCSYDIEKCDQENFAMKTGRIDPSNIDLDYLKQEFNRFKAEIASAKDKLGANATETLDQMSAYLNSSNISSRLSSFESELEQLAGKLKGTGKQAVTKIESQVVERPIASIAIAFGIGLLASQLIRKS
jgi:ElaB/YqjD/DUF883 family membrane-anchored ribosome-binding protein